MIRFRQTLFWLHLAAGLLCGLVIALLCLTGTALAFEKDLIAWSERDARRVTPPTPDAPRLSIDDIQQRFRAAQPDAKPSTIVVSSNPHTAVAFVANRRSGWHVDPYSGEVRQPASFVMGGFMQTMFELHRYLGFSGSASRPRGKLVTGIANLAFCFLAISGLYLWMPRAWSWRAVRAGAWFTRGATGRARDWNWHNTIGLWCAPVLIALTLTALPISFRWAAELTYTLTGTPLPASGPQSSGAPPPAATVTPPAAGATAVSLASLVASTEREMPAWKSITLRYGITSDPARPQPVSLDVRAHGTWPRTARTTLQFDPFTGALLQRDGHEDLPAARQIRAWTRYLHTGEALGWWAQLLAAIASLGGVVLAATGVALACRRFFGRRVSGPPVGPDLASGPPDSGPPSASPRSASSD